MFQLFDFPGKGKVWRDASTPALISVCQTLILNNFVLKYEGIQ